jgi:hypothetical protein
MSTYVHPFHIQGLAYPIACVQTYSYKLTDLADTACMCAYVPYRLYITAQKYRFLPCGVTARTKNIYLFWGCGIEKRRFLAYFGACQAKIPVRGWCKLNISRVRG